MATLSSTASDSHRHSHTEVRSPIEVVLSRIVYYIFGIFEVLLAIRFVFSLFGANQGAPFVDLIYGLTDVLMAPFNAIFPTGQIDGSVFEWNVLVALVVYALIAWGLVGLIHVLSPREHAETVEQTEYVEDEDRIHRH